MSYEADVADIAALKAKNSSALPNHARIRVLTLLQEFWLDKESQATPDDITVVGAHLSLPRPNPGGGVVANRGQGRWLRNPLPVPEWTEKREWHQDSVAGNDQYSGDDGSPVRTMAEITRRLRRVESAVYTIYQHDNVTATDSVRFSPEIGEGAKFFDATQTIARIVIKGLRKPPKVSSSFSGTSATNPTTNTQATVTDPSADWSKRIGAIVRVTSGTAKGAQAVVLKDLSAEATGKARVSEWAFPSTGLLPGIPAPADSYEMVELPVFSAPVLYSGITSKVALEFEDISFESPSRIIPSACTTVFTSCRFTVQLPGPPTGFPFDCFLHACSVVFEKPTDFSQTSVGNGPRFTACGLVKARLQVSSSGRTSLTDTVIQDGAVRGIHLDKGRVFGGLIVVAGKLGIFDSPGVPSVTDAESAVTLRRGMTMQILKGAKLYGAGNAAFGVEVWEGASLAIQASETPTITGTSGDVQIEGTNTAIPELAPGKALKAEPLSTWGHWTGSKFARNVFNYKTGSRIISTS